ncbi:unnamed protein product, partial [Nesidiocoris tenuis]
IKDSDRPALRKYREEAVKVEAVLAEKRRKRQEELEARVLAVRSQEQSVGDLDDSVASNVDTAQVLNFIRQALKDSSHVEEVQQLQQAIFEELQKYRSPPSSAAIRRCDSMDTLHNIDDFSNAAASSYEVSPTKSFPSEKFPSPPRTHLNADGQRADENSPGSRLSILTSSPLESAGDLTEPRLSLNYSNRENSLSALGSKEFTSPTFDPTVPEIRDMENLQETSAPNEEMILDSPPRPLRRNSYTLESPSPSLLQYLKTLKIDGDAASKSQLDKSSKRNLNRVWSDVLSADGSTSTPINQSALSWKSLDKSDQSSSSEQENLSVIQNNNSDLNSTGVDNEKPEVAREASSKRKYSGNNNVSAVVEVRQF